MLNRKLARITLFTAAVALGALLGEAFTPRSASAMPYCNNNGCWGLLCDFYPGTNCMGGFDPDGYRVCTSYKC